MDALERVGSAPVYFLIPSVVLYFLIRAVVFAGGLTQILKLDTKWKRRKVYQIALPSNQVSNEIKAGLWTVIFDAIAVGLLIKSGAFTKESYSWINFIASYLGIFVWFEIWFYFSHRAMHLPKFFWIHERHHLAKVTDPWTSIYFSLTERFILIVGGAGAPALIGIWIPIPVTALAGYFVTNYLLNVYEHSNTEWIPPSIVKRKYGKIINTATYHALHHARYRGNYGSYTPFLDMIFRTQFDDYVAVHSKAYSENGLTKLSEKIHE